MKKIKTKPSICRSCKYHQYFGAKTSKENSTKWEFNNVACQYLGITGHSRIFKDGVLQYDPQYCDKYEKGKKIHRKWADMGYLLNRESEV